MSADDKDKLPAGFDKRLFVCTGRVTLVGDALGVGFAEVKDGVVMDERFFKAKEFRGATCGAVYEIPATDHSCILGRARYVKMHDDAETAAGWKAREAEAVARDRHRKLENRETSRDFLAELLSPVKRVYERTDQLGRRAIELALIDALRRQQ